MAGRALGAGGMVDWTRTVDAEKIGGPGEGQAGLPWALTLSLDLTHRHHGIAV